MKILLMMLFFVLLPAMGGLTRTAGEEQTGKSAAGEILTVAAPPGATGAIIRLSQSAGGSYFCEIRMNPGSESCP